MRSAIATRGLAQHDGRFAPTGEQILESVVRMRVGIFVRKPGRPSTIRLSAPRTASKRIAIALSGAECQRQRVCAFNIESQVFSSFCERVVVAGSAQPSQA